MSIVEKLVNLEGALENEDVRDIWNRVQVGMFIIGLCRWVPEQQSEEEASTWLDWHEQWAAMTSDERDKYTALLILEQL